jgi:hypothetical protein
MALSSRGPVALAQRAMGMTGIILNSPPFDQYLCSPQHVEDLSFQEIIPRLAICKAILFMRLLRRIIG